MLIIACTYLIIFTIILLLNFFDYERENIHEEYIEINCWSPKKGTYVVTIFGTIYLIKRKWLCFRFPLKYKIKTTDPTTSIIYFDWERENNKKIKEETDKFIVKLKNKVNEYEQEYTKINRQHKIG